MSDGPNEEQIRELKDKFKRWIDQDFGGDWDKAFRTVANRANSVNTINREELLWALEQAGIGNWITRGMWADGIIKELDKSGDRAISEREFNSVFRMDKGTDGSKF
ncbi:MAG: EF-hand domain-containing protein [Deltaproteobacteria bacterium]|nr:EF-hand domain-containing protein [Deltaproteobacteria bacterium]MBW2533220.1 EF-hand domain-containing protein [Deltaproteobacteria bacterium]